MEFDDVLKMLFEIVGGLGIFLMGMKYMSEGMQAVVGDKLRRLIHAITDNRLLACGVGATVTCIIQSSSVTTVMVVGMVNANIMNLTQAIGVILGANIGTTITGWILVLKIGKYGLPILGVAAFFYLFSKRDRIRFTAGFFFGLGMVFFGLQLMKNGFKPLTGMEGFESWFARFEPTGYFGVLKCVMVGAALTAIVQSSSAILGITIGLATAGVIGYPTAAALVLGENIGTTITAILASLGTTRNARRAAYAHTLINVLGVIWITAIFFIYTKGVLAFVGADASVPMDEKTMTAAIATTHTGFNLINALLFMPFVGLIAKLLQKVVPEPLVPEKPHLTYLDVRMLDAPAIGVEQSEKEINRMGECVVAMLKILGQILESGEPDEEKEESIFEHERNLDLVQKEVIEFLTGVMEGTISTDDTIHVRRQLRMADEYESISDYIANIMKLKLKLRDIDEKISGEGQKEILNLHRKVTGFIDMVNGSVVLESAAILKEAEAQGYAITAVMKQHRSAHLSRIESGIDSPLKFLVFTDMLNAYRRIKDHALNIAEVVAGEK
jgi:phosphate:Na+ symporter